MEGLRAAAAAGHSHGIQIDADGQHDLTQTPHLLLLAQHNPYAVVIAHPLYDNSIPKARLRGRWVNRIWVWIETLGPRIYDAMIGFRVYPLSSTLALANHTTIDTGMTFDTHLLVKLAWRGVPVIAHPVAVSYPPDGISNFKASDNLRLAWMHTRLMAQWLCTLPWLVYRLHGQRR